MVRKWLVKQELNLIEKKESVLNTKIPVDVKLPRPNSTMQYEPHFILTTQNCFGIFYSFPNASNHEVIRSISKIFV